MYVNSSVTRCSSVVSRWQKYPSRPAKSPLRARESTYSERGGQDLSYFQRDFFGVCKRNIVFRAINVGVMAKIGLPISYSARGYPSSFERGASFFQRERAVRPASAIRLPSAARTFSERAEDKKSLFISMTYKAFRQP